MREEQTASTAPLLLSPGGGIKAASGSAHRRIMIVAGEASGDLHGADVAIRLRALDPGCELYGVAGLEMRNAGVRAIARIEDITGLGLSELGRS
ncbi:MAG TPA: hypothetical protein VJ728_16510, partial [Candidatus Binataceae bacterium]|nr:hypothetical protein [Candidatus Binataceae bacterium]